MIAHLVYRHWFALVLAMATLWFSFVVAMVTLPFKYSGELLFDIILWLLNSIPKLIKLQLFGYLSKTR